MFLGQRDYSMRVWLDPRQAGRRATLTATDVVEAVKNQNVQVAAGQIGQPPIAWRSAVSIHDEHAGPVVGPDAVWRHHRQDRDQGSDGEGHTSSQVVRLKDVARIELGSAAVRPDLPAGRQAVGGLAVFQSPGSNALETGRRGEAARWRSSSKRFPPGVDYLIVYDTTPFIRESVERSVQARCATP